jgi:hypothetical protein
MTRASFKTGLVATGLAAAFAVWLVTERGSYNKLRDENAALRQQISELGQLPPVTSNADSDEVENLRREHSELLKLRGEVGTLRDTIEKNQRELAIEQSENSKMLALSNALEKADWAVTSSNLMVLKYIGVACRNYAANNGNLLPTNFDQIQSDKYIPAGVDPNSFEFFDYGQALPTSAPGYYFLARETQAIHYPTGQWKVVYLLADGSVQIGSSDDGNFDSWEHQWIQQQSQQSGPPTSQ